MDLTVDSSDRKKIKTYQLHNVEENDMFSY